jgi:hypothetical protein
LCVDCHDIADGLRRRGLPPDWKTDFSVKPQPAPDPEIVVEVEPPTEPLPEYILDRLKDL